MTDPQQFDAFWVTAIADHIGSSRNDLRFFAGDRVYVTKADGSLWFGVSGNEEGWFPKEYVGSEPGVSNAFSLVRATQLAQADGMVYVNDSGTKMLARVKTSRAATAARDIVEVIAHPADASSDWWLGSLHGRSGWFRISDCELFSSQVAPASQQLFADANKTETPKLVLNASSNRRTLRAFRGYKSQQKDELSICVGDVVFVHLDRTPAHPRVKSQWVWGECGLGKGWIPRDCVISDVSASSGTVQPSSLEVCAVEDVTYPFLTTSEHELPLHLGDTIEVFGSGSEWLVNNGWCCGRARSTGKVGWFPRSYVSSASSSSPLASPRNHDFPSNIIELKRRLLRETEAARRLAAETAELEAELVRRTLRTPTSRHSPIPTESLPSSPLATSLRSYHLPLSSSPVPPPSSFLSSYSHSRRPSPLTQSALISPRVPLRSSSPTFVTVSLSHTDEGTRPTTPVPRSPRSALSSRNESRSSSPLSFKTTRLENSSPRPSANEEQLGFESWRTQLTATLARQEHYQRKLSTPTNQVVLPAEPEVAKPAAMVIPPFPKDLNVTKKPFISTAREGVTSDKNVVLNPLYRRKFDRDFHEDTFFAVHDMYPSPPRLRPPPPPVILKNPVSNQSVRHIADEIFLDSRFKMPRRVRFANDLAL